MRGRVLVERYRLGERIGLGLAYAASVAGPDFLSRGRLKIHATTQIDETRRHLHEMDGLRMAMLTKGLNRAPFDSTVRALAAAKPDYDFVDGLGTASVALANNQNDSAKLLLSSVGASLSERIDQFRDAAMAIDACDQLLRLRATAGELTALADLPEAATADRIDEVWRQATKAFGGEDFRASAATATKAASKAEQALTDALRSRRAARPRSAVQMRAAMVTSAAGPTSAEPTTRARSFSLR